MGSKQFIPLLCQSSNQNQESLVIRFPCCCRHSCACLPVGREAGTQYFFWIPGRVSLARNDNPGAVNPVPRYGASGKAAGKLLRVTAENLGKIGNYNEMMPCLMAYWTNSALVLILSCSIILYL